MKRYFLALIVSLSAAVSLPAAPPTDASLEQMLNATHPEKMLEQMVTQMSAGMERGMQQALQGKTPTPAQKAKMDEYRAKTIAVLRDQLSYAKLKDVYLQAYRDTFSQDEVNAIIAFYNTPAGKAMVEKTPLVMQKASTLMQARMGPIIQQMQTITEQFAKDLEAAK